MNLNKIIIGALSLLITLGFLGILIILYRSGRTPATIIKKNVLVSQTAETMTFQTPQGNVTVNNFNNNPYKVNGSTIVIEQNDRYQITNYSLDNSFIIYLSAFPLSQNREEAQNSFLNDLNITTDQACKLDIKVSTDIDPNFKNRDLGMSFCPNSVVIP